MKNNITVSVCCITYNQQLYISEAIESFLRQKSTFPLEIIVHDDASTDKTARVIKQYAKKYPDVIIPILQKENQYSKGIKALLTFVFPMAKGKYIAVCEGDDYWTDPYKLQKQIDYMERHPECSLCFHAAELVKGKTKINKFIRTANKNKLISSKKMFGYGSQSPMPTLLFRRKDIQKLPKWCFDAPIDDIPLKLYLSQKGTIFYINEIMAVRRIGVPNSWTNRMKNNALRKSLYPKMIRMLEGFNRYSKYRYSKEIIEKQITYEVKISASQNEYNFFKIHEIFNKRRYKKFFNKLSYPNKIALFLKCYFVNIQQSVNVLKLLKANA